MDIGSILVGLALVIAVGFVVAQPFLDTRARREPEPSEAGRLRQERDQVLRALRDLDFDYSLGKLLQEDYAPLRAELVSRGAEALKKLDALAKAPQPAQPPAVSDQAIEAAIAARRQGRSPGVGQAPQPPAVPDEAIETAIAARRQSRPNATGQACPRCGAAVQPDDRFCPRCGAALAARCPKCGTPAEAGDQFCGKCGTQLPDKPAEVSAS